MNAIQYINEISGGQRGITCDLFTIVPLVPDDILNLDINRNYCDELDSGPFGRIWAHNLDHFADFNDGRIHECYLIDECIFDVTGAYNIAILKRDSAGVITLTLRQQEDEIPPMHESDSVMDARDDAIICVLSANAYAMLMGYIFKSLKN